MSVATAVLVRDLDGAEIAHEGHAGGSGAREAFSFYEAHWREDGSLLDADPDTLTIRRRFNASHTLTVQWHAVSP